MERRKAIAIYQMGKVGSESIYWTLKQMNLTYDLYHIHILKKEHLRLILTNCQESGNPPTMQTIHGKELREAIDHNSLQELKIISAVRDPIAQMVSAFFQTIDINFPHYKNQSGDYNKEMILSHLHKSIMSYDQNNYWTNCNWFDIDFAPALGIDVFDYKFDQAIGYQMIKRQGLEVLILRLENSDEWNDQIAHFLGRPNFRLHLRNTSEKKPYSNTYFYIKNHLKIPEHKLRHIYSTKFCQHFYNVEMINGFIEKWSE